MQSTLTGDLRWQGRARVLPRCNQRTRLTTSSPEHAAARSHAKCFSAALRTSVSRLRQGAAVGSAGGTLDALRGRLASAPPAVNPIHVSTTVGPQAQVHGILQQGVGASADCKEFAGA